MYHFVKYFVVLLYPANLHVKPDTCMCCIYHIAQFFDMENIDRFGAKLAIRLNFPFQ